MDSKILHITIFNHFASLLSLLIGSLLIFGVLGYFKFESDAIMIFGLAFLIDALPALYLHFEYWIKNMGEEYEIKEKEFILRKHGKQISYPNKDIEKIIVYLSSSLYVNSNFNLLAMGSYHFAKVRLKTGEELILTCLLAPRIDKSLIQMKGVLFERRKRFFCTTII